MLRLQGAIMGHMNRRKGIIMGIDGSDGWFSVFAEVPLNEMFGYSGELRSSTQGKGEFAMEYSRYSPCTPEVQERLINEYLEPQGIDQKQKKKN